MGLGHRVTILTTSPKFSLLIKTIVIDGVEIIIYPEILPTRISRLGYGFLSLLLKLFHVLRNKYDIVHSDNGQRPLAGIPCRVHKKLHGSKYIAEWYDWYGVGGQYDTKKKVYKWTLGRYELKYEIKDKMIADGIVVLSEVLRDRARKLFPTKKILKLQGGADVSSIPYAPSNSALKEKYSLNRENITFGYIDAFTGNLKETQPLIDAIIETNLQSKVKLLLFGAKEKITESLSTLEKQFIVNLGWVDFTKDYEKLQCVDVFVLFKEDSLSNRAGWPNGLGDYMACGRAIILNPIGDVIDFVKKHSEGFFVCKLTKESINLHLRDIINNPSRVLEMGNKNRLIAENEISWDIKSKALLDFYKEIIGETL